jgi:hypothetical protein
MNGNMTQAVRETHIGQAMSALRNNCDEIEEIISMMADRITPVLRASSPKMEGCVQEKSVDETLETPLAGDIQAVNSRLRGYKGRLKDIIARIEI